MDCVKTYQSCMLGSGANYEEENEELLVITDMNQRDRGISIFQFLFTLLSKTMKYGLWDLVWRTETIIRFL
jgi:hypothetical protein